MVGDVRLVLFKCNGQILLSVSHILIIYTHISNSLSLRGLPELTLVSARELSDEAILRNEIATPFGLVP